MPTAGVVLPAQAVTFRRATPRGAVLRTSDAFIMASGGLLGKGVLEEELCRMMDGRSDEGEGDGELLRAVKEREARKAARASPPHLGAPGTARLAVSTRHSCRRGAREI
jgi:hypothetical protein